MNILNTSVFGRNSFFKSHTGINHRMIIDLLGRLAKSLVRLAVFRLNGAAQAPDLHEMRKTWQRAQTCGIVCAAGLGDALMATPLIEAIKHRKPGARVIVVAKNTTASIFARNPDVDGVISYDARPRAFLSFVRALWKIRRENLEVLFAAQPANRIRHSLIAAFSGAGVRLKHDYDHGQHTEREFSFVYTALLPNLMERHRVELNLDLLRFLDEELAERRHCLRFYIGRPAHEKIVRRLLAIGESGRHSRLIAIHPGGGRQNKWWLPERFAQVGKELMRLDFTVCLVGGREERDLCEGIAKKMNLPAALNFAGNFSLEETAALLKRCCCLLSNDSGIMHLATAVGAPVIALFGPTDFRHIGPFSPRAKIVFKSGNIQDLSCAEVFNVVWREITVRRMANDQSSDYTAPVGALSAAAL